MYDLHAVDASANYRRLSLTAAARPEHCSPIVGLVSLHDDDANDARPATATLGCIIIDVC